MRNQVGDNADLAHLVERNLAKVEVAGSSPVIRLKTVSQDAVFLFYPGDFFASSLFFVFSETAKKFFLKKIFFDFFCVPDKIF